jgi:beta-xylosidase
MTTSTTTQNLQECEPSIQSGERWLDSDGVHINAHGGGVLFHKGRYYWFGEHKIEGTAGNRAHVGVSCYGSDDLCNWENEGIALKVHEDADSALVRGCIIERPKVIYNERTGQFVMWFHHELKGKDYDAALTGLAVSDRAAGPYTYVKSINPHAGQWPLNFPRDLQKNTITEQDLEPFSEAWTQAVKDGLFVRRDFERGQMARDMALFVDDDGTAYHIHSSEENQTLHVAELTEDYLGFTGRYTRVLCGASNEAPALFKKDGRYFMISSGCTSWDPNPARSAVAEHPFGPWIELGNPCVGTPEALATTFHSQSTFVLPVEGKADAFIFMADRWVPDNAIDGRYIWLPLSFEAGRPKIRWSDAWDLACFDD